MERRNITDSPMEIYVHIPFCIKKCDYCDFLSGPSGPKEQADYVDALLEEINAAEEGKGRSVSSVFIGGGTPSVLDERFIGEILNHIRRKFQIADHAEITIEVNPGTADRNKLQAYRTYGINRLSIGLQSPDDRELKILGRIHNYEQFLETYRSAREAGFDNINIDLMSAIPDQTYEGWIHNLRTVAGLDPEHISAYSLIIEEGTPFASRTLNLPDEDAEYNMYEATAQILREYGFEQYEISNFAKPGFASRHNLKYWLMQEYAGFGPGAHSDFGNVRYGYARDLERYLKGELVLQESETVDSDEREREYLMLRLRTVQGVDPREFEYRFRQRFAPLAALLQQCAREGLAEQDGNGWHLTAKGFLVSNRIIGLLQDELAREKNRRLEAAARGDYRVV